MMDRETLRTTLTRLLEEEMGEAYDCRTTRPSCARGWGWTRSTSWAW